jgi:transposase-like protein
MASKTTNRFSPEVRARAVWLAFEHVKDHLSRWATVTSIAAKIGCTAQSLNEWVKKAEIDSEMRVSGESSSAGNCSTPASALAAVEKSLACGARMCSVDFASAEAELMRGGDERSASLSATSIWKRGSGRIILCGRSARL